MTGLRERKKNETRQHIADVAARLFAEHGFDEVTVDQVAAAADVAKKTVFNYFPTKEDLVFDRAEARELTMVSLVRDRPPGTPVLAAFRAQTDRFLDFVAGREPGFQRGSVVELARSSPALRRRGLEIRERHATVLAAELAADTGQPEWDPVANAVARTILATHQSVFFEIHRLIRAGATPKEAAEAARVVADRVFGLLERGLADYPAGTVD
ncbi:MAG TPA: TetR family transcriptional regulator [Pseudonocardiaceae bacterium]|jgi:AcrR family transcriptional regulator|nr:TetR family transcriptional regulator [Pseudonocardiaceae bacterium]